MKNRSIQLFLISLLSLGVTYVLWLAPDIGIFRVLLTLYLVWALGHTTLMAWAVTLHLRRSIWILMTLILGIALITLGGIVLNFTPWGLQLHSWLLLITSLILVQCLVGLFRRPIAASNVPRTSIRSWNLEFNSMQVVSLMLAIAVTCISVLIARTGSITQPRTSFSQLWMVLGSETDTPNLILGIKNEEQQAVSYKLIVRQGSTIIYEYSNLLLQPNNTWNSTLALNGAYATTLPIEAELYRTDEPNQPYRTVSMWFK